MNAMERYRWLRTRERFQIADPNPSPPVRPERMIGEILCDMLKGEKTDSEDVPDELLARWPAVAGPQLAKHTRPAFLKKNALVVYADHPGWLNEIRRLPKAHFLKKLCGPSGQPIIQEIRFELDPEIRTPLPNRRNARR